MLTFLGIDVRFSDGEEGEQLNEDDEAQVGNHLSCVPGGFLEYFKNKKFTEYLFEIDKNEYKYSDDKQEKVFSFGQEWDAKKRELVYVEV